jgi:hypothetical protein
MIDECFPATDSHRGTSHSITRSGTPWAAFAPADHLPVLTCDSQPSRHFAQPVLVRSLARFGLPSFLVWWVPVRPTSFSHSSSFASVLSSLSLSLFYLSLFSLSPPYCSTSLLPPLISSPRGSPFLPPDPRGPQGPARSRSVVGGFRGVCASSRRDSNWSLSCSADARSFATLVCLHKLEPRVATILPAQGMPIALRPCVPHPASPPQRDSRSLSRSPRSQDRLVGRFFLSLWPHKVRLRCEAVLDLH